MRNMKKRISFLLAVVMLFALLAVPANAVEVKDGKAIVTDAEIDAAILLSVGDTVTIMCPEVAMVSKVEISAKALAKVDATGKKLAVVSAFAAIEINHAAINNIVAQVGEEGVVTLALEINPTGKLNEAQSAALKEENVLMVLNTDVVYEGKSLDIGEDGYMVAKLPEMLVGDMIEQYVVAHLDENGKFEVVDTDYVDGYLLAKLDKLAVYVIMNKPAEKPEEPVAPVKTFEDVAESDWFYNPVMWAVNTGVTGGKTENSFAPTEFCTRAQVVTFLYAAAGKPEIKGEYNPFNDVSEDDWFYKPVMWAVENGITGGKTENTFAPNDVCTRAQVVTFLYAAAGKPVQNGSDSAFSDVNSGDWYLAPVLWAVEKGVTGGTSETTFGPADDCTRAQVVTFLYANAGKPAIK